MDADAGGRLPEIPGWVGTSRRCVFVNPASLVLASQKLTNVRFVETHFARFQVAFSAFERQAPEQEIKPMALGSPAVRNLPVLRLRARLRSR